MCVAVCVCVDSFINPPIRAMGVDLHRAGLRGVGDTFAKALVGHHPRKRGSVLALVPRGLLVVIAVCVSVVGEGRSRFRLTDEKWTDG